jgi:two-component system phosphate regulon sensor histidine kinase PhoR
MPSPSLPAPVLVTLHDVTEMARTIAAKTDFVANASHELRTPIAALRMAAETLQAAGSDQEMRARVIGMIQNHVVRLDELVRDMLDLSKLESFDAPVAVKPLRMTDLAGDLYELFEDSCRARRVELVFQLDPALEHLRTDKRLLMLIAKNLVENAAKFARSGTTVRVVADARAEPDEDLDALRLRVIDRGPGIPLEQQRRIFERFYQVDSARTGSATRGSGLGLAIVKHACKVLGGRVSVESELGRGTTMTVDLPGCVARSAHPG